MFTNLGVDEGHDTTLGDDNVTKELVQPSKTSQEGIRAKTRCHSLLIVTDGKLQVARNDTLLLVVAGSVTSELENLGSEVLEDSREVYWQSERKNASKFS